MTGYEWVQFVHVLAATAWVGGAIGIFVLQTRLRSAGDAAGLMAVGRQMEKFAAVYFSPLATLTLLTGILMVATTDGLDFEDPWIAIGLAGILITLVIGLGFIRTTGGKLVAESEKPQPDRAALAGYGKKMGMLTSINIAVLVFVIFAMVVRLGE